MKHQIRRAIYLFDAGSFESKSMPWKVLNGTPNATEFCTCADKRPKLKTIYAPLRVCGVNQISRFWISGAAFFMEKSHGEVQEKGQGLLNGTA